MDFCNVESIARGGDQGQINHWLSYPAIVTESSALLWIQGPEQDARRNGVYLSRSRWDRRDVYTMYRPHKENRAKSIICSYLVISGS